MAKDKFILVSLKEDESKKLAQILSNDTSRKILDYLADKEATESEMAEKLNIPISTVHYNLQALLKGRLVEADEYHYSQKGKEVLHYKLANKYVIIAPKSTFGIKEKLKRILPVAFLGVLGSGILYWLNPWKEKGEQIFASNALMRTADAVPQVMGAKTIEVAEEQVAASSSTVLNTVADGAMETAKMATENVAGAVQPAVQAGGDGVAHIIQAMPEPSFWQTIIHEPALWFLVGSIFTLLLIIIVEFIAYKRKGK